ncbi:extensin family protein [Sphingomonas sp. M1-B02]|uniref:extensin family protein n=1 Tax=Sphingomonas sp. M1-B02 TaxID=3114300 RepID=UPI00223FE32D|nr:extensin family protein [Sphingomonas sp. S6-11]UZK65568.1 extensin family protein [Sphingomonas sp. S6-11]
MRIFAALLPFALASCISGGDGVDDRPAPIRERVSGPITLNGPTRRETQQCYADLSREEVRFSPLPDRDFGSGCIVTGAVELLDIGVPVTSLKSMRCPLARTFTAWVRYAVAPAAKQILGSELVRVESFGTYSCRGIIGNGAASSARISEHGLGNAVDVGGFVLADGRRIRIETHWRSNDPEVREFLRVIQQSACKRFRTVLGPDYNAAHYNHLHLDMGRGPFCR